MTKEKVQEFALEKVKEFEEKTGARVVYVTVSGSRLYGTFTNKSDYDLKAVFVPSKESVLLKQDLDFYDFDTNKTKEKNTEDDVDFALTSVYKFFNLLEKSETGALDMMFSMWHKESTVYQDNEFVNLMKENYKSFQNRNMKAFVGYALSQTQRFSIKGARYDDLDRFVKFFKTFKETVNENNKLGNTFDEVQKHLDNEGYKYVKFVMAPGPRGLGDYKDVKYLSVLGKLFEGNVTVEYFNERVNKLFESFGNRTKSTAKTESKTDFKAASHSLRLSCELQELLETGFIKFPLRNAKEVLDVKNGNVTMEEVVNKVQKTLDNVDELLLKTDLPENSNKNKMNELLLHLLKTNEKY